MSGPLTAPDPEPTPAAAEEPARVSGRAAGAALVALGSAVALQARAFEVAFITDPLGPKAFPLTAAMLLAGAGLALLVRPGQGFDLPPRPVLARMLGALLAFVVYALILPFVGFVGATTLAVWSLSLIFGGPWRRALVLALLFSLGLQFVFAYALALSLPLGSLWIR